MTTFLLSFLGGWIAFLVGWTAAALTVGDVLRSARGQIEQALGNYAADEEQS